MAGVTARALIVGGGIGGMACAIALGKAGVTCDLIDLDPEWRVYGAGITLTRPTLRAFRALGLLDALMEVGFAGDGIQICLPDGTPVTRIEDPVIEGDPLPGSGGVMRPDLHRILSRATKDVATHIRLGLTVDRLEQDASGVTVRFSDGTDGRYDLVVGADGIGSRLRDLIRPEAPQPDYTGQTVWRLFAKRPPELVRRHYFLGDRYKVGLCPVSADHLYLFLVENAPRAPDLPERELHLRLREMLRGYGGFVAALAAGLGPESPIVVRPLKAFLLPPPWHVGRTVLVGDAAHPTTPQLASGAGLAVEDALVLAEELTRGGEIPEALARFTTRRWDRCRMVVENSLEIGRREQAGRPPEEQTDLVEASLRRLAEPV